MVDISRIGEIERIMRDDQKESFRKWAAFAVSTLALLVTCLRDPIALTLKATIQEVLRQELPRYETTAASDSRWEKQQEAANELLKRYEHDMLREQAALRETDKRLLIELSNRLTCMEEQFDMLMRERQRERKFDPGDDHSR